jgi:hypothetical protein
LCATRGGRRERHWTIAKAVDDRSQSDALLQSALNFIQPYSCLRSNIRSLSIRRFAPHLGRMKQVGNKTGTEAGKSASRAVPMRPLDPDLLKFVETLAIADAKRDHSALSSPAPKRLPDAAGTRAGSSTNDTRSHLCKVFDRASERKID